VEDVQAWLKNEKWLLLTGVKPRPSSLYSVGLVKRAFVRMDPPSCTDLVNLWLVNRLCGSLSCIHSLFPLLWRSQWWICLTTPTPKFGYRKF